MYMYMYQYMNIKLVMLSGVVTSVLHDSSTLVVETHCDVSQGKYLQRKASCPSWDTPTLIVFEKYMNLCVQVCVYDVYTVHLHVQLYDNTCLLHGTTTECDMKK